MVWEDKSSPEKNLKVDCQHSLLALRRAKGFRELHHISKSKVPSSFFRLSLGVFSLSLDNGQGKVEAKYRYRLTLSVWCAILTL
jgi:hypothetical protein